MKKSPLELIAKFNAVVPGPPARARNMFGYPCAFVNDNMFMGLFAESMFLRLPTDWLKELSQLGGTPFEPMAGRPMAGYGVLPASIISNTMTLSSWVAKVFRVRTVTLRQEEKKGREIAIERSILARRANGPGDVRVAPSASSPLPTSNSREVNEAGRM